MAVTNIMRYYTVGSLRAIAERDTFVKDTHLLNMIFEYENILRNVRGETYSDDDDEEDIEVYDSIIDADILAITDAVIILATISSSMYRLDAFCAGKINKIDFIECFVATDNKLHDEVVEDVESVISEEELTIDDVNDSKIVLEDAVAIANSIKIIEDFYKVLDNAVQRQLYNPNLSDSDKKQLRIFINYAQNWSHKTISCVNQYIGKLNGLLDRLTSTWLN